MSALVEQSLFAIASLRREHPGVHCITNSVAQHFTANVLLACGAVPSMTIAEEEITEFVGRADALLINLGTMDKARTAAVHKAVEVAGNKNIPFVLDPVFAQASSVRLLLARELAGRNAVIIRANAAEVGALFDLGNNGLALAELPSNDSTCLVVSGKIDWIVDGQNRVEMSNGTPLMARVTAMGCALSALMAALAAVEKDRLVAASAALLWYNIAGEVAAEKSTGPGTFVANFLDALANIDDATIEARAAIK